MTMLKIVYPLKYLQPLTLHNHKYLSKYLHIEHLKTRSLVKVEGVKADEFLQGMITNDIKHLDHASSVYTMLLNVQGRVMFDCMIFRDFESFILDCDRNAVLPLINHLKLHKVRRKINFELLNSLKVCVLFENNLDVNSKLNIKSLYLDPLPSLSKDIKNQFPKRTIVAKDSRLHYLGDRLLLPVDFSLEKLTNISICKGNYKILRYKLGIGEGVDEITRDKCLPLEANCDYLHGVSFQKGCYIGQELTARTHHTGIVRKRYMPLIFSEDLIFQPNSKIVNEKGKVVGKTIINEGRHGIGLMRIEESLESLNLKVGECNVTTFKPGWWPIEATIPKLSDS